MKKKKESFGFQMSSRLALRIKHSLIIIIPFFSGGAEYCLLQALGTFPLSFPGIIIDSPFSAQTDHY